jgi:hypothetical protein
VLSPVLLVAAVGLLRLARRYRSEAVVAGSVTAIFVVSNCGYFDPYGGSPGPRFLVVGLPFLALGLGPAFARAPRITLVAAAISVIPTSVLTLTWSNTYLPGSNTGPGGGIWGELVGLPEELGSSPVVENLSPSVLSALGLGRTSDAAVIAVCTAAAFVIAALQMPWSRIRERRRDSPQRLRLSRPAVPVGAAAISLVVSANVLAAMGYPYGQNPGPQLVVLQTSISAPSTDSYLGGDVNFKVSIVDRGTVGAGDLFATIDLPPGMRLVGPPALTRGSGCTGSKTLICNLGFLEPFGAQTATVVFGVQITQAAAQKLTAWSRAQGDPRSNTASFDVSVGN